MKAFVYLRLSVDKEDGRAQSIDAQRYEIELYAKSKGYEIVGEFVDSGVSGRKISRPQFDNMISLACAKPGPVKAILVYRLDRFARNQQVFHNTIAYLDAARVQLISVSEYFGNGRQSRFIMSHTAIGAEQYSINASIQTAKSRRDNARRGHWNGGPIPFGCETYPVAIDGKKERMRLRIVEKEAMIVREIFDWADLGQGGRWICKTLNDRGIKMRGARWSNSNLAGLLSREHYRGTYYDRTVDEDGNRPKQEDWIAVPCPPIIDVEQAERVAALRASRNPRKRAPHVAAATTLLTGIARCGNPECGCVMTINTGKSGQYICYKCANKVNKGMKCPTPNIRREALDGAVIDALETRLLKPERLQELLADILNMSDKQRSQRETELGWAKAEKTRLETALNRLIDIVETGQLSARDPVFAQRLADNKTAQVHATAQIKTLEAQLSRGKRKITADTIAKFSQLIREKLRHDEDTLRTAYVRMFVIKVTVNKQHIVISGPRSTIESALTDDKLKPKPEVPSFDREWCPTGTKDGHSNHWEIFVDLPL
jgi:DNA invertase Pin-like site-specific DNA recombinase